MKNLFSCSLPLEQLQKSASWTPPPFSPQQAPLSTSTTVAFDVTPVRLNSALPPFESAQFG